MMVHYGDWDDDIKLTLTNKKTLREKAVLRRLFNSWYERIISFIRPYGPTIEIGSGGGFFKEIFPDVFTSDILHVPGLDVVFDATKIPFKNSSVMNIVLNGVLHHIKKPLNFFDECERVLMGGGRIIINDPFITPFSYFIHKYIHPEFCDYSWEWEQGEGKPLIDCNLAMATIIFKRKLPEFNARNPNLQIIHTNYHNFFIYLLTGGYSYPALIPNYCFKIIMCIEKAMSPFSTLLASNVFIVIEKK